MTPKVCIIGAGSQGFSTAKKLQDAGIEFDCFEMSDDVGGNWYFRNPNGMSACYESLHIDTSTTRMQFADYPAPDDWPHFPHHSLIHQYFRDYVDHFGLREKITFNTAVEKAVEADGGWDVTLSDGTTRHYDTLVVANGHHWKPRMPEYPGQFDGQIIHSHEYISPFEPIDMHGKTVIVVGMGNSGMDLGSELSHRSIAKKLYVSARRGVWVLKKYRDGVPADKMMMPPWMPKKLGLAIARKKIKKSLGKMSNYGLPEPDHEPLAAHPSVSVDFLERAGSGDITCIPAIERLDGDAVILSDGRRIEADVIVCATGYDLDFPFFDDPDLLPREDNSFPLFKRMIKPGRENLVFIGCAQSSPAIIPLAEQQSKLLVGLLQGTYQLPSVADMERIIVEDEENHRGQYYAARRHTIQVDFGRYRVDLDKEVEAGRKRAEEKAKVPA
ncbi:MAG: NAD(P)-binding domain-containing protein [Propionibacterium sp.]|nr:NAD(P)-binding domain-containing protein [Propionibacterium sp.]